MHPCLFSVFRQRINVHVIHYHLASHSYHIGDSPYAMDWLVNDSQKPVVSHRAPNMRIYGIHAFALKVAACAVLFELLRQQCHLLESVIDGLYWFRLKCIRRSESHKARPVLCRLNECKCFAAAVRFACLGMPSCSFKDVGKQSSRCRIQDIQPFDPFHTSAVRYKIFVTIVQGIVYLLNKLAWTSVVVMSYGTTPAQIVNPEVLAFACFCLHSEK